jgi:hypothetical protein
LTTATRKINETAMALNRAKQTNLQEIASPDTTEKGLQIKYTEPRFHLRTPRRRQAPGGEDRKGDPPRFSLKLLWGISFSSRCSPATFA